MDRTREQWLAKAALHADYLAGLQDGSLGRSDLWNPGMTVPEAIEQERRNVAFCLREAAGARTGLQAAWVGPQ